MVYIPIYPDNFRKDQIDPWGKESRIRDVLFIRTDVAVIYQNEELAVKYILNRHKLTNRERRLVHRGFDLFRDCIRVNDRTRCDLMRKSLRGMRAAMDSSAKDALADLHDVESSLASFSMS